jgi:hypothetical protein
MYQKQGGKIFKIKELQEMLYLAWKNPRRYWVATLARKYGCCKATIIYHLRKHGLMPDKGEFDFNHCKRCGILKISQYYGNGDKTHCEDCLKATLKK